MGLTQAALAEKSGLSLGAIKNIERDLSHGWTDSKEAIAKALECTLADLYREPGSNESLLPEEISPKILSEIQELRKEIKNDLKPEIAAIVDLIKVFDKKQLAILTSIIRSGSIPGLAVPSGDVTSPKNFKKSR